MNTVDLKVKAEVIKNHRGQLSNIGAALGGKFWRVGKVALNQKYGEVISNVRNEGNRDLCLNRGINRYKIEGFDIFSVTVKEGGDGTPAVFINEGAKDADGHSLSVSCPIGAAGTTVFVSPDEDTIGKALVEKSANTIFADPTSIVNHINTYNENELRRIDGLITMLQTAKNSIQQTIENNNKRAQEYMKELNSDESSHVTVVGHAEVTM